MPTLKNANNAFPLSNAVHENLPQSRLRISSFENRSTADIEYESNTNEYERSGTLTLTPFALFMNCYHWDHRL